MKEWERRWKLKEDKYPKDKIIKTIHITQYRLNETPYVRVRESKIGESCIYTHTVKYGVEEIECDINKKQYDYISSLSEEPPIIKDRIEIDLGNELIGEIDLFLKEGKWVIEIEFPSEEAMNDYTPPKWFGEELKDGVMYSAIELLRERW